MMLLPPVDRIGAPSDSAPARSCAWQTLDPSGGFFVPVCAPTQHPHEFPSALLCRIRVHSTRTSRAAGANPRSKQTPYPSHPACPAV